MENTTSKTAEVWHALSDELRVFLRSRLPSEADADDLLQDVFVRVMEKFGSLREADRIASWVFQIARNEIADFYRRRALRPMETVEEAVAREDAVGNRNYDVGAWLSVMIGGLPETMREAVRMYEVENLPQSEIALRLNTSLSGAKSRVQRGRRQLEKLLRGCCELELDRRGNVIECQPAKVECCSEALCQCSDRASPDDVKFDAERAMHLSLDPSHPPCPVADYLSTTLAAGRQRLSESGQQRHDTAADGEAPELLRRPQHLGR